MRVLWNGMLVGCKFAVSPNLLLITRNILSFSQRMMQSRSNDSYPITSISFHARESLIFYSIDNRIVIWNYHEDVKTHELFAMEESRIK